MGIASLISGSDVRGKAIGEGAPLTEAVGHRLGQAFVRYLKDHGVAAPKVAVGRDPRLSGERLEAAIAGGMASAGAQVTCFGLATTPAMFMALVRPEFGGDASVMVTASHLPWERNGYKFFLPDGGITGKTLKEILALADSDADFTAPGGSVSRMDFLPVYAGLLEEKIRTELGGESPLSGLKVAVDAGNGAGGFYAALLSDLGADTSGSQFLEPDGHFPNHIPNPENPDAMDAISRAVLESHSDLGVIFDTDCDRAAIVDAGGREINRNRLIALISAVLLMKEPGATIVTDSVTSSGLADFIAAHGGVHHRFKRGYRNVIDESRRLCAEGISSPLAIETSGHAALRENYFLDDGMYLVTRLIIEAVRMQREGKKLTELIADLREPAESAEIRFAITDPDFRTAGQKAIDAVEAHAEAEEAWHIAPDNREGIRVSFDLDGKTNAAWFLLRLSLHDPVLPLNLESDVPGGIRAMGAQLLSLLSPLSGIDVSPLKKYLEEH